MAIIPHLFISILVNLYLFLLDGFTKGSTRQDEWPSTNFTEQGIQKKGIHLDVEIKSKTLEFSTFLQDNVIGLVTDVLEMANENTISQELQDIDVILKGRHSGN